MNDDTHLSELLTRYVAGACTPVEVSELSARLERDSEACDLLADILKQGVAVREFAQAHPLPVRMTNRTLPTWMGWFTLRPFMASAAAGIVFGVFCASLAFAYARPTSFVFTSMLLPLTDSSFESGLQVPARGIPAHPGVWSGDFSRVVVAENGVTPTHGKRMLRFMRSDHEQSSKGERSYVGEVAQVIDLRPLRAELSGIEQLAEVSAQFNAIPMLAGANHEFAVKAAAFRGDLIDAPELWGDHDASISRSAHTVWADVDAETWQRVAVALVVPPEADFLVIECAAVFRGPQGEGAIEFGGHYVDQVHIRLNGSAKAWAEVD